MGERINAVDAVKPAIQHTGKQLFMPFRFGVWLRLAVLGLLTAEFSGGSSGSRVNLSNGGSRGGNGLSGLADLGIETVVLAVILGLIGLALGLLLLYISAVCRFILFDAVLRDRYHLREGFRRWSSTGLSYFFWQLGLAAIVLIFLAVVIGIPLLAAFGSGVFERSEPPVAMIVGLVIVVLFLVIPFFITLAVVSLFARDFVVPIMAMEDVGILAGWRLFFPMLRSEILSYVFYVLFKIVLAIASAIVFGIATLIVIIFPLLFFAAMGAAMFFAGLFAGLTWNVFTVALAIMAGVIVLVVLLAIAAFISTPAVVFFQAYRIHFFGSRYEALEDALAAGPFGPEPAPPTPQAA